MAAVCERCELLVRDPCCDLRSDQGQPSYGSRCVRLSDGGRFIGRAKKEGKNSYGGFGISSTVIRLSVRRVRKLVERCCSCTWHSTCSTTGPSAQVCECGNAGRKCTGCYCWGRRKNRGRIMPSLTTEGALLGHLPHGAYPPATDQRALSPPVRFPTSFSLRAISTAGAEWADIGARGTAGVGEADQGG